MVLTFRVAEVNKRATIAELQIPKGNSKLQFTGGELNRIRVNAIIHPDHPLYTSLSDIRDAFDNEDLVQVDTGYDTLTNFKISTLICEEVGGLPNEFTFSLILTRVS